MLISVVSEAYIVIITYFIQNSNNIWTRVQDIRQSNNGSVQRIQDHLKIFQQIICRSHAKDTRHKAKEAKVLCTPSVTIDNILESCLRCKTQEKKFSSMIRTNVIFVVSNQSLQCNNSLQCLHSDSLESVHSICEQQMFRSDCSDAQSDQSICRTHARRQQGLFKQTEKTPIRRQEWHTQKGTFMT